MTETPGLSPLEEAAGDTQEAGVLGPLDTHTLTREAPWHL